MKCLNCGYQNKETAKTCKKCTTDLTLPPSWFPDWTWHAKALGTIYAALLVIFLAARHFLHKLPPPYNIREIPPKMTPWLHPEFKDAP
jgi:hypothetical protein